MQVLIDGHQIDTDQPDTWKPVSITAIASHVRELAESCGLEGHAVNVKRSKADAIARLAASVTAAGDCADPIVPVDLTVAQPHDVLDTIDETLIDDEIIGEMAPTNRTYLAKRSDKVRAWFATGGKPSKNGRVKSTRKTEPQTVRFVNGDKPMPDSQNSLSSLAWYASHRNGGDRMNATALRTFLAERGIDDPTHTTWSVELPNGVEISAVPIHPKQTVPAAKVKTHA